MLWMFLKQAEPLADAEADAAVHMDVEEPLEDALARAVGGVADVLGLERPSVERMGEALAVARAYEPKTTAAPKDKGKGKGPSKGKGKSGAPDEEGAQTSAGKKAKAPRYYGILAEFDPAAVVEAALARAEAGVPPNEIGRAHV